MKTISVAIVTYNEERHIEDCLKSVTWADEIVVLDGHSADNTAKIAKKYTKKVFEVENQPLMKKTMNQAFKKCTGDWILSLDADERVDEKLVGEIKNILSLDSGTTAYRMPRKNIVFGKWIEKTFWYPDFQLRLFKNGKAKFPEKNVHEELEVDGEIGELQNAIVHLNYETVSQYVRKLDSYTTYEAEKLIKSGKKLVWTDAIRFPVSEFLTRFFSQEGYLDGLHGLVLSLLQAFYWEVVFAKVWEAEGFWQYGDKSFVNEVDVESTKVRSELKHWFKVSAKKSGNLLKYFKYKCFPL